MSAASYASTQPGRPQPVLPEAAPGRRIHPIHLLPGSPPGWELPKGTLQPLVSVDQLNCWSVPLGSARARAHVCVCVCV